MKSDLVRSVARVLFILALAGFLSLLVALLSEKRSESVQGEFPSSADAGAGFVEPEVSLDVPEHPPRELRPERRQPQAPVPEEAASVLHENSVHTDFEGLTGRVLMEHSGEGGWGSLTGWVVCHVSGAGKKTVQVENGEWVLPKVDPSTRVRPLGGTLAGQEVWFPRELNPESNGGSSRSWVAQWLHKKNLWVLDAQTEAPLQDVKLYSVDQNRGLADLVESRLLAQGTPPILLDPEWVTEMRGAQLHCIVCAVGRSSAFYVVNFDVEGDEKVQLEVGGELEVFLEPGTAFPEDLEVAVWESPKEQSGQVPLHLRRMNSDNAVFGALRPGKYTVRVQRGLWYGVPTVYGESVATVNSGERVRQIVYCDWEQTPTGILEVRADVHESWAKSDMYLELRLLDSTAKGSDGKYVWTRRLKEEKVQRGTELVEKFEQMAPGRYALNLMPGRLFHSVEIEPGRVATVDLVVPAQAEVVVELVNDGHQGPIVDAKLRWRCECTDPTARDLFSIELQPDGDGLFRFQAPCRELWLQVMGEGYSTDPHRITIGSGALPQRVELSPETR